jgi:hypothetical protein
MALLGIDVRSSGPLATLDQEDFAARFRMQELSLLDLAARRGDASDLASTSRT